MSGKYCKICSGVIGRNDLHGCICLPSPDVSALSSLIDANVELRRQLSDLDRKNTELSNMVNSLTRKIREATAVLDNGGQIRYNYAMNSRVKDILEGK